MNIKYFFLCFFLISTVFAYPVKMPPEPIITERLIKLDLGHFLKITKLNQKLGGKHMEHIQVYSKLKVALAQYNQRMEYTFSQLPSLAEYIQKQEPLILEALLQDSPWALESLKQLGFYIPRSS